MTQPVLLDRLHKDHARLARILDALEATAARCRDGARGALLDKLATLVDYIAEYPDAVHHPLEDRIFAHMNRKQLTEQERRVLEDNVAQHEELAAATRDLVAAIDALLRNTQAAGAELQPKVDGYVELQRQHMRNEEGLVFPLARATFSETDWASLEQDDAQSHDPLFDRRLSRYESLYEYAMNEA